MELSHFHLKKNLRHSLSFLALKNSYELQKLSSWCPWLVNEVFYTSMKQHLCCKRMCDQNSTLFAGINTFSFFFEILRPSLGFLALKKSYELQKKDFWCPRIGNEVPYKYEIKFVPQENVRPQFYVVCWNPSSMYLLHKLK